MADTRGPKQPSSNLHPGEQTRRPGASRPAVIVLESWREQRNAWLGWVSAWLVLIGVYTLSWPSVEKNAEKYDELMKDMPEALQNLMGAGGAGSLGTPEGYFSAELLAVTGPLLLVAMGILLGTRLLAGEEESGALELLLAQPVSRAQVLGAKLIAGAAAIGALMILAGAALAGAGALVGVDLSGGAIARMMTMLGLLGIEGLSLGLCAGALLGRLGPSRAAAGGIALSAFLLHAAGAQIELLAPAAPYSPFATLLHSDPLRQSLSSTSVLALAIPSVVLAALALWGLRRRDLRLG